MSESPNRGPAQPNGEWLVYGVSENDAKSFLHRHQLWRMELKFSSGPKASDGPIFQPFQTAPLNKLRIILEHVPHEILRHGRVLDVGSNAGYNSIYLAQAYNARVLGIDISRKNICVAEELAAMLGADAKFKHISAEEFERDSSFDLILHLGTLYHLANPVRSLAKCFRSLKKGGWFALETICYRGSGDKAACKWINGLGGDHTNFWALGEGAIASMANYCGIGELRMVFEAWPEAYNQEMSRGIWVGQR